MPSARMRDLTHVILVLSCQTLLFIVSGQNIKEVCFQNLECFPLGDPWSSQKRPVPHPQGPVIVRVDFLLFTRKNPKVPFIVHGDSSWNMEDSFYDIHKTTYVVFHGWNATANNSLIVSAKDDLLKGMDSNVILTDYGSIKDQEYAQAVSNIRVVAAQVARFLNYLIEFVGATPSKFHLSGLSLGAHAAAYTAKRIPRIARLTGLDPAYVHFEGQSPVVRIDKSDAVFVDVVHTNGNPTIPYLGLGMSYPIGHVDFYFNGGWNQPGCTADVAEEAFKSISKGKIFEALSERFGCPHLRAISYFAEAFSNPNCTFWGVRRNDATAIVTVLSGGWLSKFVSTLTKCNLDNCIPFGFTTTEFPARGSFDVATLPVKAFCDKRKDVDVSMERQIQEYRHNLK